MPRKSAKPKKRPQSNNPNYSRTSFNLEKAVIEQVKKIYKRAGHRSASALANRALKNYLGL